MMHHQAHPSQGRCIYNIIQFTPHFLLYFQFNPFSGWQNHLSFRQFFMRRFVQYDPFNIYCFEAAEWQHPIHKHTYFEIIFIRSGNGKHSINGNVFHYEAGDVFLLGPEDYHYFDISTHTSFAYIRFNEAFVKDSSHKHGHWQMTIESLLTSAYQSGGSIIKEDEEKKIINHLLEVLIYEYRNRQDGSYEMMMDSVMKAMLSILARNLIRQTKTGEKHIKPSLLIEKMLMYIRQNIYEPDRLRLESMAENFPYSQSHLSSFFKKQVGESLQQYILKYKLRLVEDRLQKSSKTISEICHEFGFADESHLNKVFRKYYGIAPGVFRKKLANNDR